MGIIVSLLQWRIMRLRKQLLSLKTILAIQMPFFLKWQDLHIFISSKGFPRGSVVKNPLANAGDYKRCWFDPWVGKIPWRG